jgi:hypothetical protein
MSDTDHAALEVWKATIDVQKHFNDLCLRVRSIAVTVLGAFLAAAGYALREHQSVTVLDKTASLAGLILLAGLVCWTAFWLMDRLWYHRLLRAAVRHGRKVEQALVETIPVIGLTGTIDDESPLLGMRAGHRLSIFYGFVAALLFVAAGMALVAPTLYYVGGLAVLLAIFLTEFWPQIRSRSGSD